MEAEEFLRRLDAGIPPLTLLIGGEHFYIEKIRKKIREKWLGDEAEKDIAVLPSEPAAQKFSLLLSGSSFFSTRTLIEVRQSRLLSTAKQVSDEEAGAYLAMFKTIPEHCRIVIQSEKADARLKFYKAASALGQVVECALLEPGKKGDFNKLKNWLTRAAADYGSRWESDALSFVTDGLSMLQEVSLAQLAQEIEKMSLYAGAGKSWSRKDAEIVFSDFTGLSGFVLIRALAEADALKALDILRETTARGVYLPKTLGLIALQLRRLLAVKSILERGGGRSDVIAEAGIRPYFADETIGQCRKIPKDKIKNALAGISAIAREAPFGGRGIAHLEEIIVEFCR
ncbi:MAG: DNA polymerase III subunit delta [Acidaminococcales bacterium]|jgi:DNA polymerase III delta subunit|nr:DNA polymerase III subunit delta [Acidaminococcales bacterium]